MYHRRQDGRGPRHHVPLLLLLLLVLLGSCILIDRAEAIQGYPNEVAHIGDVIPVTVYLRTKRQLRHTFIGYEEWDTEVGVDEDVEEIENSNVEEFGSELFIPSGGTPRHPNQIMRTLPLAFCPRFGIQSSVKLQSSLALQTAGKILLSRPKEQQSDSAIRVSLGMGLRKESTWLPFVVRRKYMYTLYEQLETQLDNVPLDDRARMQRQRDAEDVHNLGENGGTSASDVALRYLAYITLHIGYQTGDMQRITSFSVSAHYSELPKDEVQVSYVWDEHRAYNPHRAIAWCSAVAVVAALFTILILFHPSGRVMVLFTHKMVTIAEHED